MRSVTLGFAFSAFSLLGLHPASAQSLLAYIAPPTVQQSSFASAPGVLTETFNSLPQGDLSAPYVSTIGTYEFSGTSQGDIVPADSFGGAADATHPGGTQYMAFGSQSGTSGPITIKLNGSYNYFGFYFSAGDVNNGVTFYSNGTEFARFSTANVLSLLSGSTVTALNGTTYASSAYLGNPNNGLDPGEPFAYVEIITTQSFDTVVLDNSGTTGTGFETDNDSVLSGNGLTITGSDVFVSSLTVVPEPKQYMLVFGAWILALVGLSRMVARIRPGLNLAV